MSRTLIQEGLIALKEIAQRGTSPSYSDRSRDNIIYKTAGARHPETGEFSAINFPPERPRSGQLSRDIETWTGIDTDEKYKEGMKRFSGAPTRYHRDGNYVEFNRSNYAKPYGEIANRDRQTMLDAGGLELSTGRILYQDPYQQQKSLDDLRNTLATRRNMAK